MKIPSVLFCAVTASASLWADGGPAHQAINAAQRIVRPPSTLIEMTGERGEPRPQEWRLVYRDTGARGGVREIAASGDVVLSERTPLRGYAAISGAQPIVLDRLKLDSDAAFEIANRQATAQRVGFHWIDYTLRTNDATGAPLWVLRLYDHMGAPVGVVQISAEDGSVLVPLNPQDARREDEDMEVSGVERTMGGVVGTVGHAVERTAITVKDASLNAVGTVQEVLTGERTIGQSGDGN